MTKNAYFKAIRENNKPNLFDKVTNFWASHTKAGISYAFEHLSSTQKRRLKLDNMHLLSEIRLTSTYGLPIVNAYQGDVDFEIVAYSKRSKCCASSTGIHFFGDDEKIIPPTWNNLDKTTMKLMGCPLVIGPDPSLYIDLGMAMNITNLYRTRFTTSHWQQSGIPTVPVFTFGDIQSLSYCLDGFPEDSVVALTGVGHERSISSEKLWLYCVNRMIEEKHPRMLIIYGGTEEKYNSLGIPYKYIPDHIHSKLRSL